MYWSQNKSCAVRGAHETSRVSQLLGPNTCLVTVNCAGVIEVQYLQITELSCICCRKLAMLFFFGQHGEMHYCIIITYV